MKHEKNRPQGYEHIMSSPEVNEVKQPMRENVLSFIKKNIGNRPLKVGLFPGTDFWLVQQFRNIPRSSIVAIEDVYERAERLLDLKDDRVEVYIGSDTDWLEKRPTRTKTLNAVWLEHYGNVHTVHNKHWLFLKQAFDKGRWPIAGTFTANREPSQMSANFMHLPKEERNQARIDLYTELVSGDGVSVDVVDWFSYATPTLRNGRVPMIHFNGFVTIS